MKKQKIFNLDENSISVIKRVKEEKKLSTETAALEFIIAQYEDLSDKKIDMISDAILDRMEERYKNMFTRIRLGTTAADKNVQILMELMNSIIAYKFPDDVLQPTTVAKTGMLEQAEDEVKSRIAYYKQLKDNKDRKNVKC